jgi:hypothetical protein
VGGTGGRRAAARTSYPVGVRLIAALMVVLGLVAPAAAAPPDDLSADPLERAALLAVPSVYELRVEIEVPALRREDGTRIALPPAARRISEGGTAFGVGPGWLATAAHVVSPRPEALAGLAYQRLQILNERPHGDDVVQDWLRRTGARPVGARVVSVVATQADAGEGARSSRAYPALDVRPSEAADLALVRIAARAAPALELDEAASTGTPVLTVGFGRGSVLSAHGDGGAELVPALREGELRRTGSLEEADPPRQAIAISVPVERGDSGAPVVDAAGRVRGVVIQRTRTGGGIAERATELRQLMERVGVTPAAGLAAEEFRAGMERLWALDPAGARTAFDATLAIYPDHTLATRERTRAGALEAAGYDLGGDRTRGLLLGVGVLAAVIAAGFGVALLLRPPAPGPGARGR